MSPAQNQKTIRAFVAIDLPPETKEALGSLQEELRALGARARWVKPENIHLTLKFLGSIPAEKVPAVREAMQQAARQAQAFEAQIADVGAFPNERRPRVLWVGMDEPSGQLLQLQRRLEEALKPLGFEPEDRPFRPHLTLARVKEPKEASSIAKALRAKKGIQIGKITVQRIVLYQSTLRPQGAIYNSVEEVLLRD